MAEAPAGESGLLLQIRIFYHVIKRKSPMNEAPCLGTALTSATKCFISPAMLSGPDIISGQMMKLCPCTLTDGVTGTYIHSYSLYRCEDWGLRRLREFPNITQLRLIYGGQKLGVESLDLKTQGCCAPKSTSFVLYHDTYNDVVGFPMGDSFLLLFLSTGRCCLFLGWREEVNGNATGTPCLPVHSHIIPTLSLRVLCPGLDA